MGTKFGRGLKEEGKGDPSVSGIEETCHQGSREGVQGGGVRKGGELKDA